jgi:hypothetical protein
MGQSEPPQFAEELVKSKFKATVETPEYGSVTKISISGSFEVEHFLHRASPRRNSFNPMSPENFVCVGQAHLQFAGVLPRPTLGVECGELRLARQILYKVFLSALSLVKLGFS